MTSKNLRVGLVQQTCTGDRETNLAASEQGIREAATQGAGLVVLQELHASPYFCQREDPERFALAEPIPGPTTERIAALAAELGVAVVASVFERRAPGVHHNTAVVADIDGSLAGIYRKMHIPDDPGYHEKYYFAPGDLGFHPIPCTQGRLGVLICWDQWYPEAARLMALAGAELLIYPTAIGWDAADPEPERTRQRDAWITVQRGHAIANALPVICCNRMGHEPDPSGRSEGIRFWGSSFVAGPQGEILAMAEEDGPKVLVADIERSRAETVRRVWPFFRDRRIDAYEGITRRYLDEK